jgi:hypothetical protein
MRLDARGLPPTKKGVNTLHKLCRAGLYPFTSGSKDDIIKAIRKHSAARNDADDVEWITANGTHIPMKGGEPQSAVGRKILGGEESGSASGTGDNTGSEGAGPERPAHAGTGGVADPGVVVLRSEPEGDTGTGGGNASEGGDPLATGGHDNGLGITDVSSKTHDQYANDIGAWGAATDPKNLDTVDVHTAAELKEMGASAFGGHGIGADGSASTYGAAVKPDGDIIGVYSGVKGKTKNLMLTAIANGGNKLDAYAVNNATGEPDSLAQIYHKFGFVPVARVRFNAEYAKEGFEARRGGGKDSVAYRPNGDSAEEVARKYGTYPPPTKEQYDRLPIMGYDDAIRYRDSLIGK